MTKSEINIWKEMAKLEVETAKELSVYANSYLLLIIKELLKIISKENPYTIPTADIRYRSFVIEILSEYRKQNLPDYRIFYARVLLGKY